MKDYNKKINDLFETVKGDDDLTSLLVTSMKSFSDYVAIVNEFALKMYEIKDLPTDEYQEAFTAIDKKRHDCHEAAIMSVSVLNRLCERCNLEKFADVDVSDRYAVADFAGEFTTAVYVAEIARTRGLDNGQ